MERDEQPRSVYEQLLEALEQALYWLERPPAEGPDAHDPQRAGIFSLGVAGGLAFAGLLPGINSEALFDDISDAAEQRDLDQLDRIRRSVSAKLGSDRRRNVPSPGRGDLDWEAGALQMLAVLKEVRTAQDEGAAVRYSLMMGFLAGCLSEISWGMGIRYRQGSLQDAVLAAHDRNPECAGAWVKAESITARKRQGESAGTDPRVLLLRWVGDRLAAAQRMSSPLFFSHKGETEDQRQAREAEQRAYYDREETSIQRAQNFGRRIAGRDSKDLWVPMSYALNRGLVLESHKGDHPDTNDQET